MVSVTLKLLLTLFVNLFYFVYRSTIKLLFKIFLVKAKKIELLHLIMPCGLMMVLLNLKTSTRHPLKDQIMLIKLFVGRKLAKVFLIMPGKVKIALLLLMDKLAQERVIRSLVIQVHQQIKVSFLWLVSKFLKEWITIVTQILHFN